MRLSELLRSHPSFSISPSIRRLTTEWSVRTLLWAFFVFMVTINIHMRVSNFVSTDKSIFQIIQQPLSAIAHNQYAQSLWGQGREAEAKEELLLTQSLVSINSPSVLGITSPPMETLKKWQGIPSYFTNNYQYWIRIIDEKPDYRDAYLQAAKNLYELHNYEQARDLTIKAQRLDPDYPPTITLLSEILVELKHK